MLIEANELTARLRWHPVVLMTVYNNVLHSTPLNSSHNLSSYPPDNHS